MPDDPMQGTILNTQRLVQRISELEDLVQEFKNQSSPQDILNLREIIASQSAQMHSMKSRISELSQSRYQSQDLFDKNELYLTYQKLIEERDDLIK